MNNPGVVTAMQRGMAFISSAQQPDGGFASLSSPTKSPFKPELSYQTVFGPALILAALTTLDSPEAMHVRHKLAAWLLEQKGPNWSFNYWAISAPQRQSLPYPDDLDDTFCALIALNRHDPSITDASCLGNVVKLLIAAEQKVGGPYRTWLAVKNAPRVWQDVDLAVNGNIACFLSQVAEPLPNLTAMIEEAIKARSFDSPYYPSAYPIIYYLSRAYQGEYSGGLAAYLEQKKRHGWWGSPLKTALAVVSLSHMSKKAVITTAVEKLLESQLEDGSWPAEAFCLDPAVKGQAYYSGSPALTTALVLEALASQQQTAETDASLARQNEDKLAGSIYKEAGKRHGRSLDLDRQNLEMLNLMRKGDKDNEIVLLPYVFNDSLVKPLPASAKDLLRHLSLANLYGWTAYTIYDDFLDGEGDPQFLSVANTSLRNSLRHFREALPENKQFQAVVDSTFDTIDQANAWELENCRMEVDGKTIRIGRLPKFAKTLSLADRSIGHTLAPLGVLAAIGIKPDDQPAVSLNLAIRHYLVARQLNDDMHDWEQDLKAGLATYVVAAILQDLALPPGKYSFNRLLPKMQRQFWHHTLNDISAVIAGHVQLARRCAKASGVLLDSNILTVVLGKIDDSLDQTLKEQRKAKEFLAAYSQKTGPN